MTRRLRGERAVTVVEAAFVMPLFLLFVFALLDLGYGIFQTSQATSAARDGARVGIVDPTDTASITAAAKKRAVGERPTVSAPVCYRGLSDSPRQVIACADAGNGDRIFVEVSWTYEPPTFVGQAIRDRRIVGSATMVIGGRPRTITQPSSSTTSSSTSTTSASTTSSSTTSTSTTTSTTSTTVPGQCVATRLTASPSPIPMSNKNKLANDTTFVVETNGASTCSDLDIVYSVTATNSQTARLVYIEGRFQDVVTTNEYNWDAGSRTVTVKKSGVPIGTFLIQVGP